MTGTWINVGAVVAGALVGRALGSRFRPQTQKTVTTALGCVTMLLGIQNALIQPEGLETASQAGRLLFFLIVLISILFGVLIGEGICIERWLERLGAWAEARLGQSGGDFGRGFVVTSLLFCVGPLTILGSFQDGLQGDYSLLATKSVLDGFAAAAFAAALGWGVMLSALTVLVIQGSLTLGAHTVQPLLVPMMIDAMTASGGVILVALGIRLLDLKPIPVANFLPALILAPLLMGLALRLLPHLF
jgi:uncharacterized protein